MNKVLNEIILYLEINNIPHNKKYKKDNILILPNAIIKIKKYNSDFDKLIKLIQNIELSMSQYNFPIYILLDNIDSIETYEKLSKIFNQYFDPQKVILTYSFEQVIIGECHFAIKYSGIIWTLVSNYSNIFPIFNKVPLYVTNDALNRAYVMMTDEEIYLLHSYLIISIDELVDANNICYITQNTFNDRYLFTHFMKNVPLQKLSLTDNIDRNPCRIIDGITIKCPNCSNIVFIDNYIIRKHNYCI
jgi:hypothetical protein